MTEVLEVTADKVEYEKGDLVEFVPDVERVQQGNYGDRYDPIPGNVYTVSRVYKNKIEVRGDWTRASGWRVGQTESGVTISVDKTLVVPHGGPRPRKLGEKPEGDEYISPMDPRLKWFWEDAAVLAKNEGYCGQYDALAAKLGVPGRERNFKVITQVAGLSVTTTVRAHSRDEAEAIVAEKLGGAPNATADS